MTSDIKPDTHLYPRTTVNATAVATAQAPKADGVPAAPTRFGPAVAESAAMRSVLDSLERIAPTDVAVLLEGEAGTGKEMLARAVHDASARANSPLVFFDCTLASTAALEPELFGLERNAGGSIRKGALENAEGGTIVFDEIGDLPMDLQVKLTRALESKEYRRLGGTRALHLDARIIATSRRDLKHEAERSRFLSDLLVRLGPAAVETPPLRARREDVRSLVQDLLRRCSEANPGSGPFTASDDTIAALACHEWPGNVRELRAVLERAVEGARLTGEREIRLINLPGSSERLADPYTFHPGRTYRETRARFEAEFERRYVKWLLGRHHGNISAAAREVQMDRKYLYDLAKKHGMRGKEEHDS